MGQGLWEGEHCLQMQGALQPGGSPCPQDHVAARLCLSGPVTSGARGLRAGAEVMACTCGSHARSRRGRPFWVGSRTGRCCGSGRRSAGAVGSPWWGWSGWPRPRGKCPLHGALQHEHGPVLQVRGLLHDLSALSTRSGHSRADTGFRQARDSMPLPA